MSKNFILKSATSLSKGEMKNVKGGVSRKEYCDTLIHLVLGEYAEENWTKEEWISADNALRTHCVD